MGGVFFDDWSEGGFDQSLSFVKSIGDAILPAYQPILERRLDTPYTDEQKEFQLYRRGRYAEFNGDRPWHQIRHSIRSAYRVRVGVHAATGYLEVQLAARAWHAHEAELYENFLKPVDWLSVDA